MPKTDEQQGETPAPVTPATNAPVEQPEVELGKDGTPFDAKRAQALIDKQTEELKEAKKAQKRLAELEAKEKARADAELSELEKANQKNAELEARITAAERREQQRKIAEKVNLPAAFAERIQGVNEADMEADAQALLAAMPVKVAPQLNPTNPGAPQTGETDDEHRIRLGLKRG